MLGTCGGVALSFCTAVKQLFEPKKRHQDCLVSLSAQLFYGPCLWLVAHTLTRSFSGNEPLLYTSTQCLGTSMHVILTYSFSARGQVTNTWMRFWEGLGTRLGRHKVDRPTSLGVRSPQSSEEHKAHSNKSSHMLVSLVPTLSLIWLWFLTYRKSNNMWLSNAMNCTHPQSSWCWACAEPISLFSA